MAASCALSLAVVHLIPPSAPAVAAPSPPTEFEARLAGLRQEIDELRAAVRDLDARPARQPVGVDEELVRSAVREWLTAHSARIPELAAQGNDQTPTLPSLLERLAAEDLSDTARMEIWREAHKAGAMYDLLDWFEQRAANSPGDADAQSHLGSAYLLATQQEDNPMRQGDLATKADLAFDAALAIDERHWDARFQKGLALSFWPSFLGKKKESIRQFEILVEQQETMKLEGKHAQSYLYLGNLYEESDLMEKAREVWRRGLRYFPEDAQLQARVR